LDYVYMSNNVGITHDMYVSFFNALTNTSVDSVRLFSEHLQPETVKVMCQALSRCKRLTMVQISEVQLEDASMCDVVTLVRQAPKLQRLTLDFNRVTSEGVKILAPAVKDSLTLIDLSIWRNPPVDQEYIEHLLEAVKCHRSMRIISPITNRLHEVLRRLHTNKAKVMTVLLAAKRLRSKSTLSQLLSVDLIRHVGEMLT